ncbi:hypothetical protein PTSG_05864 [Salpingoeca rosetta]|uniref:MT-A70 family protein n=1 Tax=Salpingoeca rosetta (strain ATCC 50818 / BSB-021) TaxID=946362 RepID=F2UD05_SALR5|nr:uncharacterized protein PTSG_05864 [Salpingoeca rosetta]EGD74500.1 hypothetical protein PTSG_05864 [Salpingoeca rosetta]|eukprot:XP_004992757.1 hypothetical protein PTSG_05864 [Salpingoeca rosetta]
MAERLNKPSKHNKRSKYNKRRSVGDCKQHARCVSVDFGVTTPHIQGKKHKKQHQQHDHRPTQHEQRQQATSSVTEEVDGAALPRKRAKGALTGTPAKPAAVPASVPAAGTQRDRLSACFSACETFYSTLPRERRCVHDSHTCLTREQIKTLSKDPWPAATDPGTTQQLPPLRLPDASSDRMPMRLTTTDLANRIVCVMSPERVAHDEKQPADGQAEATNTKLDTNCGACCYRAQIDDKEILVPSPCRFLLANIQHLRPHMQDLGVFDLIVMDPPWHNGSVRRGSRYGTMDYDAIMDIPIPFLMSPRCLLALWITNNDRCATFVHERLLPHWGLKKVTEWKWLKVTTQGEPVFPLSSRHKRPYEVLILATNAPGAFETAPAYGIVHQWQAAMRQQQDEDRREQQQDEEKQQKLETKENEGEKQEGEQHQQVAKCSNHTEHSQQVKHAPPAVVQHGADAPIALPADLRIAGVPSLVHSEKPPAIHRLLVSLLTRGSNTSPLRQQQQQQQRQEEDGVLASTPRQRPRCLEVFARRLHRHWTSVGNQVFKLQDVRLYDA